MPKQEIAARVDEMLALVATFRLRRAQGGSTVRRATPRRARPLPRQAAEGLLLDEPLAALDRPIVREETRFELKALQARLQTTFVIVTHDQDEAMTVADRGLIVRAPSRRSGRPSMLRAADSRWVAEFVGDVNLIEARVAGYPSFVALERDGMRLRAAGTAVAPGKAALALRPEKIRIGHAVPEAGAKKRRGRKRHRHRLSRDAVGLKVRIDDGLVEVAVKVGARNPRERSGLSWAPDAGVVLLD